MFVGFLDFSVLSNILFQLWIIAVPFAITIAVTIAIPVAFPDTTTVAFPPDKIF
jgi:hypothetical protein